VSWIEKLRDYRTGAIGNTRFTARSQNALVRDPWRLTLERVRGEVCDDGVARITTQALFDLLEVPQRNRGAAACRRLAQLMRSLGWSAVRVRGLTRGGYLEQVRGWARDARYRHITPRFSANDPFARFRLKAIEENANRGDGVGHG
jgi:hypothetical protein